MKFIKNLPEYFITGLLLSSGALGIFIAIADFLGLNLSVITPKTPTDLILLIVSSLATALGVEIVLRFKRYDERIERVESILNNSLGAKHLLGHEKTYKEINRLCGSTQSRVCALLHLATPEYSAPPEWPRTVARRFQALRNEGIPARLDAVIVCNFAELPSNFASTIEERKSIYKRHGVDDVASPYLLDTNHTMGFDTFIIDNIHAVIAFRSPAGKRMISTAIVFENQPEIVNDLVDWFEHFIYGSAISYEKWLSNQTSTPDS